MDPRPQNSPIQTRRTAQKKNAESTDKSAGKQGDQTAVAPTVTAAFAKAELVKAKSEMNMYKLRAQNLEEKVEALTEERDFLRTQLPDGLKKGKVSQRHYGEDHERGKTSKSVISIQDSESHSESDSDSSDSSMERKKKKKKKKKRKFQKESDSESDSESDRSDSSVEKKKRKLKKKKGKKAKKEKKSKKETKHHYRQRVGEPSEVVRRYKTVLGIFQKGKTMAEAFNKFGVDRSTISQTAEIAELAIAALEKYAQLVQ